MQIFASKATLLAPEQKPTKSNIGYMREPTDDYVDKGEKSGELIDSSFLNYYLNSLTKILNDILTLGISQKENFNNVVNFEANNEALFLSNNKVTVIREGVEESLDKEATEASVGVIDLKKCFNSQNPLKNNVPLASKSVKGRVKKNLLSSKKDINKSLNNIITTSNSYNLKNNVNVILAFSESSAIEKPLRNSSTYKIDNSQGCKIAYITSNKSKTFVNFEFNTYF